MIVPGEEVAHGVQVAAGICARKADLRCAVEGRAATNDDCTDGFPCNPTGETDGGFSCEVEGGAGEAEA